MKDEPAFPTYPEPNAGLQHSVSLGRVYPGLTKLEYFAAAAMPTIEDGGGRLPDIVARIAFDLAEAMLAEGERRKAK